MCDGVSGPFEQPSFLEGFAVLEKLGLVFDCATWQCEIPQLTALAKRFPAATIILDHIGTPLGWGPYKSLGAAAVFDEWKEHMTELATCPNVVLKISGLTMPCTGWRWETRAEPPSSDEVAEATGPWYLFAIELFGVERCMFCSNFPVDRASCSYGTLYNSFKKIVNGAGYSEAEKRALFCDNAARVYKLDVPGIAGSGKL